jgi:RNA polymerase sigma factor (sigma-70 family)
VLLGASDERLVALARAGDEQAFAAIVERYRAPLLRYCTSFLPPAAAEDALQQTFINAYAALSRESALAPVSLRPWLYRVAHNAALNVARDPQAGLEELPEGLDGVGRPDEVFQQRERLRRVVGAVTALPAKQRQVIVRHALDGESHERIATDLGMSPGSIRQLAHRARRTVREAAAALLPTPLARLLPWGADAVEAAPAVGGGAVLAKVAVVALVAGAGGGAVEVAKRDREPRAATVARAPDRARSVPAAPDAQLGSRSADVLGGSAGRGSSGSSRDGSSGNGSSGSGKGSGSSGRGSGGGSSGSDSSGSGSSGSGSSGSGSSGSGSSGSGSSRSGSSASGSAGSDSSGSGSGSDSSGSGSSGSGSSGSGSSGTESGVAPEPTSSGSDSSGSGSSGSDDSDSSGSGSSGSDD